MSTPAHPALPVESGMVVADADRAVGFYRTVLGFEEYRRVDLGDFTRTVGMGEPGRLVWTRSPIGQVLKFYDGGHGSSYTTPAASGPSPIHHFTTAYVADLDASLALAEQHGGTPETDIETLPNGVRVVFLRDPDGHILEIVQRPADGPTP